MYVHHSKENFYANIIVWDDDYDAMFFYEWVQKYIILCHVIGISSYSENLNLYNVFHSHRVIESSIERVPVKNIFSFVYSEMN